jgi:HK97 family phage major capsid protein
MTARELREKRNKLLVDAQAIMRGDNVTAEQRAAVDQMLADANVLLQDAQRVEQLEQFSREAEAEQRSSGRIPRSNPSGQGDEPAADTRTWEQRRLATNRALRAVFGTTDAAAAAEARRLAVESRDLTVAANGGVMIPVGVTDPRVALQSYGAIYDIINKLRTTAGDAVKIPYLNDTANLFVLNSAAITTTDPATGGVTSQIDDIRMNPILVEYSLIQDVGFDLVGFIQKACQTRYLRTVSKWATLGNTSNVAGYATANGYNTGVTANTTLVTKYADITSLIAALDPAYSIGACFTMSNGTLMNQVLQIVDGNQRPIFLPFNDGGISGFAGTIFGYPVKINPFQPNNAIGALYMHFGNFEAGYTFREVGTPDSDAPGRLPGQGVVMLRRLDERYAELNKVGFVGFARVGGSITNPGSVGGTPAPVVALIGK